MQIAHSAYPDSPLGPDAFHEYESLLVQDYEELVKKDKKNSRRTEGSNLKDISQHETRLSARDFIEDKSVADTEDVGKKLVVSVHHFPMILCPFSPRVFVLPSEGSVGNAYLSVKHEDALSPGLPPLSTGLLSDGDDIPAGATLTANFLYHLAAKVLYMLPFPPSLILVLCIHFFSFQHI